MISIKTHLFFEALLNESAKQDYFIIQWAGSLVDTKLTKEQITKMLENVADIKVLKMMSDYFYDTDGTHYLVYQPADDSFIKDSERTKIINSMSEYIYKYITH